MSVTGKLFISGEWITGKGGSYQAINPANSQSLEPSMSSANAAQVEVALQAAEDAFQIFKHTSPALRAKFLRDCADEIMQLGDELLERVSNETGYPRPRAEGERARTCFQLRMFADHIESGDYYDARIDTAIPDRTPPKPDVRFMQQAIGPVVVFGASNFPLAFSVAGGDTAAAFAAGCPVLVKGHSSHPGTCELVAQAIAKAVQKNNLPAGTFSLIMGSGADVGSKMVLSPFVKAVGFTGSFAGGMALVKLANEREEPIPVFAEMGSVNPIIFLPEALKKSSATIATGYVGSITLGTGQFCVNPGLALAIDGPELEQFIAELKTALGQIPAGVMLNKRICGSYGEGVEKYLTYDGVELIAQGQAKNDAQGFRAQATIMSTTAENFLANSHIHEEIFGPAALLVKCNNKAQLLTIVNQLKGQLTGTLHCTENELASHLELVEKLRVKVGRLVINQFPTGVEVCPSMVHGGPFPASTDSRFTAVGTASILRFLRPVCYQNFPQNLLPEILQNKNSLQALRTINSIKTRDSL